jgi:ribosomal protein S27AE
MRCKFTVSETAPPKQRLTCSRCGYAMVVADHWKPSDLTRECRRGVGAELSRLIAAADQVAWFAGLQLKPSAGCGCASYATQLDAWGPEECRRRRDEIIDHLVAAAAELPLPEFAKRIGAATLLDAAIASAEA